MSFEIKTVDPVTVAFIEMQGPYEQMPQALGRLYGWIAQHGLQPSGEPRACYSTDPAAAPIEEALWEVRAPLVSGEPSAPDDSGVGVKPLPAARVAWAVHKGPFETIAETYRLLGEWVAAEGLRIVGPPEELYLSDPAKVPPSEYLTEVRMPVDGR